MSTAILQMPKSVVRAINASPSPELVCIADVCLAMLLKIALQPKGSAVAADEPSAVEGKKRKSSGDKVVSGDATLPYTEALAPILASSSTAGPAVDAVALLFGEVLRKGLSSSSLKDVLGTIAVQSEKAQVLIQCFSSAVTHLGRYSTETEVIDSHAAKRTLQELLSSANGAVGVAPVKTTGPDVDRNFPVLQEDIDAGLINGCMDGFLPYATGMTWALAHELGDRTQVPAGRSLPVLDFNLFCTAPAPTGGKVSRDDTTGDEELRFGFQCTQEQAQDFLLTFKDMIREAERVTGCPLSK